MRARGRRRSRARLPLPRARGRRHARSPTAAPSCRRRAPPARAVERPARGSTTTRCRAPRGTTWSRRRRGPPLPRRRPRRGRAEYLAAPPTAPTRSLDAAGPGVERRPARPLSLQPHLVARGASSPSCSCSSPSTRRIRPAGRAGGSAAAPLHGDYPFLDHRRRAPVVGRPPVSTRARGSGTPPWFAESDPARRRPGSRPCLPLHRSALPRRPRRRTARACCGTLRPWACWLPARRKHSPRTLAVGRRGTAPSRCSQLLLTEGNPSFSVGAVQTSGARAQAARRRRASLAVAPHDRPSRLCGGGHAAGRAARPPRQGGRARLMPRGTLLARGRRPAGASCSSAELPSPWRCRWQRPGKPSSSRALTATRAISTQLAALAPRPRRAAPAGHGGRGGDELPDALPRPAKPADVAGPGRRRARLPLGSSRCRAVAAPGAEMPHRRECGPRPFTGRPSASLDRCERMPGVWGPTSRRRAVWPGSRARGAV